MELQWAMAARAQWTAGWRHDHDGQWWRQWTTENVAIGDGNSGGTIAMGNNSGGAMDGRKAAQLWQLQ